MSFLLITLLMVFIIDISGFIEEIETILGKWLKGKVRIPKPFSCSLCCSWWVNIIYALCSSQLTLINLCIIALFALLTPVFLTLLTLVREILILWIEKAFKALK